MMVTRRIFLPLVLVAVFLTFSTVSVFAKDKGTTTSVNGTSTGTSYNNSTCDPTAPHPMNLVCTFDVYGTYSTTGIGSGTYSGRTRIDYSKYGTAGTDPNGGGPCTPISGSIRFKMSPGNTLTTMLAPTSKICETGPAGAPHDTYLVLTITGGTGQFHGATGTINSKGVSTDDPNPARAKYHYDTATLSGSITLEHGNGGDHGDNNGDGGNGHHGDNNGDQGNNGND